MLLNVHSYNNSKVFRIFIETFFRYQQQLKKVSTMKTNTIPSFARNSNLQQILKQLVTEFSIEAIFYKDSGGREKVPQILICTENSKEALTIKGRKWVTNAAMQSETLISVQTFSSLKKEARSGNPFLLYHYQSFHLIYGSVSEELTNIQEACRKKVKVFINRFRHDHQLLLNQAHQCHANESMMGSFLNYISIFEHDVDCLERLYLGNKSLKQNLHQRIDDLMPYLPVLEQFFVRKNSNTFYLLEVLEKAKIEDDESMLNYELYPAIFETEVKLYELVIDSLRMFKLKLKQQKEIQISSAVAETPLDGLLSEALATIISMSKPDEIYHYHTTIREKQTVFYLLLVGNQLGTALLNRIQQSVSDQTEGRCLLVLIGHSRSWIQDNIYLWQGFFEKTMTSARRVYFSKPYHPAIHWEKPYTPYYPDLDLYYRAATRSAEQFITLRKNHSADNYEGYYAIFATAFCRILRVYIYRSLVYMPNYLAPETLWRLCTYAQPELEKLEYLFNKVSKDRFFLNLDHYLRFTDHITYSSEEQLLVMEELLLQLIKETELLFESS